MKMGLVMIIKHMKNLGGRRFKYQLRGRHSPFTVYVDY